MLHPYLQTPLGSTFSQPWIPCYSTPKKQMTLSPSTREQAESRASSMAYEPPWNSILIPGKSTRPRKQRTRLLCRDNSQGNGRNASKPSSRRRYLIRETAIAMWQYLVLVISTSQAVQDISEQKWTAVAAAKYQCWRFMGRAMLRINHRGHNRLVYCRTHRDRLHLSFSCGSQCRLEARSTCRVSTVIQ